MRISPFVLVLLAFSLAASSQAQLHDSPQFRERPLTQELHPPDLKEQLKQLEESPRSLSKLHTASDPQILTCDKEISFLHRLIKTQPTSRQKTAIITLSLSRMEHEKCLLLSKCKPNSPEVIAQKLQMRMLDKHIRLLRHQIKTQPTKTDIFKRTLAQLEHEKRLLLRKFKPDSPEVIAKERQIRALREVLKSRPQRDSLRVQGQLLSFQSTAFTTSAPRFR